MELFKSAEQFFKKNDANFLIDKYDVNIKREFLQKSNSLEINFYISLKKNHQIQTEQSRIHNEKLEISSAIHQCCSSIEDIFNERKILQTSSLFRILKKGKLLEFFLRLFLSLNDLLQEKKSFLLFNLFQNKIISTTVNGKKLAITKITPGGDYELLISKQTADDPMMFMIHKYNVRIIMNWTKFKLDKILLLIRRFKKFLNYSPISIFGIIQTVTFVLNPEKFNEIDAIHNHILNSIYYSSIPVAISIAFRVILRQSLKYYLKKVFNVA